MKRFTLAAVAACILLLAGCGGNTHHPQAPVTIVLGHACDPANQVMQCVLPPPPVGLGRSSSPALAYGEDFAWSCPSPSGHAFGASYLSDTSKDWTIACLHLWHVAGKATVFVWETAGTRALNGCSAGASDARAAAAELARDGAPARQPFDMAIDFDATGPDVASYFHCASQAEPGRVNDYGGALPTLYLHDHGDVGDLNWVTYAWLYRNAGVWPPANVAPLEQYLNGSSVDLDRAIAGNYGQWPYTPPKPPKPPGPTPAHARDLALAAYHNHYCNQPVMTDATCAKDGATVVAEQLKIPGKRPVCWGPHAQTAAAICQIVRPEVSVWSHARRSSQVAYSKAGCHGPAAPIGKGTRECLKLMHEADWFDRHAQAVFKEWK